MNPDHKPGDTHFSTSRLVALWFQVASPHPVTSALPGQNTYKYSHVDRTIYCQHFRINFGAAVQWEADERGKRGIEAQHIIGKLRVVSCENCYLVIGPIGREWIYDMFTLDWTCGLRLKCSDFFGHSLGLCHPIFINLNTYFTCMSLNKLKSNQT